MLEFTIPILPITVRHDCDKKMQRYEVPGIELDFIPGQSHSRKEFTGVFVAGGKDGIALSFCAEVPGFQKKDAVYLDTTTDPAPKSWVFNHHCLEVFIQPEGSPFYYSWEISASGSCLDYRVAVEEGILKPTCTELTKPASGVLMSEIAGKKLFFDYDWKSNASWKMEVEEEFWYLELFIPWTDFGLPNTVENPVTPATGSKWRGTINRIIPVTAAGTPVPQDGESQIQALQSLLDFDAELGSTGLGSAGLGSAGADSSGRTGAGEIVPRFHQPELFAQFQWQVQEKN